MTEGHIQSTTTTQVTASNHKASLVTTNKATRSWTTQSNHNAKTNMQRRQPKGTSKFSIWEDRFVTGFRPGGDDLSLQFKIIPEKITKGSSTKGKQASGNVKSTKVLKTQTKPVAQFSKRTKAGTKANKSSITETRVTPRPTPKPVMTMMSIWAPTSSLAPMNSPPTKKPVTNFAQPNIVSKSFGRYPAQKAANISSKIANLFGKRAKETKGSKLTKGSKTRSLSTTAAQYDTSPPVLSPSSIESPFSQPVIVPPLPRAFLPLSSHPNLMNSAQAHQQRSH